MDFVIKAAGIDFQAQQRGDRPSVVFLHGFGGDLHTWDGVWSALGDQLSMLRYDLRGFGRSAIQQDMSFNHADDLLAILDRLGIDRCDLVGVSMGGSIALNFALDHAERVRNLVLISPGLVAWEWSEAWRALWRAIVAHARSGDMDEARRLWWQHPLFATTRASTAGQSLHESIMRFSGAQWVHDTHRPMLPDVERLHLLKARTLLLTGDRDFEDFRLVAELIEASISDLRRIDYPGSGHLLNLEAPVDCARQIMAFLSAV